MDFQERVRTMMTEELTTVTSNEKVENFKNLFTRRGFHHLPVEDERGKLVGIISTEDINKIDQLRIVHDLLAKHIMTAAPVVISEDKTLEDVVSLFLEKRFRALPVIDGTGDFVGLITIYDLVKEMYRSIQIEKKLQDTEDIV